MDQRFYNPVVDAIANNRDYLIDEDGEINKGKLISVLGDHLGNEGGDISGAIEHLGQAPIPKEWVQEGHSLANQLKQSRAETAASIGGDTTPSDTGTDTPNGMGEANEENRQNAIKSLAAQYMTLIGSTPDVDQKRGRIIEIVEKSLGVPSPVFRNYVNKISKLKP
jgi:hypothetical protein